LLILDFQHRRLQCLVLGLACFESSIEGDHYLLCGGIIHFPQAGDYRRNSGCPKRPSQTLQSFASLSLTSSGFTVRQNCQTGGGAQNSRRSAVCLSCCLSFVSSGGLPGGWRHSSRRLRPTSLELTQRFALPCPKCRGGR